MKSVSYLGPINRAAISVIGRKTADLRSPPLRPLSLFGHPKADGRKTTPLVDICVAMVGAQEPTRSEFVHYSRNWADRRLSALRTLGGKADSSIGPVAEV